MNEPQVPLLEVREIHKRFGAQDVLKGVSLRARRGDVVSLLGSSGSGKSTLLRCINYLEHPDGGQVVIDGEIIATRPGPDGRPVPADPRQLTRLRARVGFVFQSFNLWPHRTVLENVMEGPVHVAGRSKAEARDRAEALLDRVGLGDRRSHYPSHLSGGQQQRVAIARTLALDPDVILFDEPTSALDPELVGEVLSVIRGLAEEGRTLLIVTHELGFAREVSTWSMFLHQGRVEEEDVPENLFKNPQSERVRQFMTSHVH